MNTVPICVTAPPLVSSQSDASYFNKQALVADLYHQMKDQSHMGAPRSLSSAAQLTSLCVDISPSSSHFFEVLYIGKIKISHKKVPETFIDDALEKFHAHELEKTVKVKKNADADEDIRRGSVDSNTSDTVSLDISMSSDASTPYSPHESPATEHSPTTRSEEHSPIKDINKAPLQITHTDPHDHNRTMVLQVGRSDLRLISPDRKLILLHKQHKDVASCIQGLRNSEHFGFICREPNVNTNTYIGYIFKCESNSVASDAVNAISQAFTNPELRSGGNHSPHRPSLTSCEHCPMVWYHRLCAEVENLSDRKTQAAIFRKIDQLEDEEQNTIVTKFKGAETDSIREQNEFLMMLLRAHCEMKQTRHMHDTAENRSEFLNQYLGGSTIFMKAKRSLSNSFDHLLKRKSSKDDMAAGLREMSLPVHHLASPKELISTPLSDTSDREGQGRRTRTLSDSRLGVRGSPERLSVAEKSPKSPMLDIFMKVGNSPRASTCEESPHRTETSSWRQAIFNRVVTPGKGADAGNTLKRSREELRALWRKSIHQAVLLVRMEKENAKLRARQEVTAVKRIKLEYDEMNICQPEIIEVWELLISKESRVTVKCDNQMLLQAIRQGVPRGKRGEVWQFLAEQYCLKQAPVDIHKFPNYNVSYESLLKQLTSHQHAILIDLGRTFPNHSYFSSPLGPGQLALFNLLKAYSLLDPEVGYCQGLSFVAGVLLLHMEEGQAFYMLRHIMFRRGLRAQYLPDMNALQIELYQLSRLLHDQLPDLYEHFNTYEVAPTLYAAPWILTLFASQFPLGFVTRVFDILFLEGTDVVFKVAISLLLYHKDALLACDSFEEIMGCLRNTLPAIDKVTLDKVMRNVFNTDVGKQLNEYRVEYQVLQEEMSSVKPQIDLLHRLENENKSLLEQNRQLATQLELAAANIQRLERNRTLQQAAMNRLEVQSRGLEVSVITLGTFIDTLVDDKVDVEIPGEVRRIVSQLMINERRQQQNTGASSNLMMKTISNGSHLFSGRKGNDNRHMVKSLSTGRIGLNLADNLSVPRSQSLNSQAEIRHDLGLKEERSGGIPLKVIQDDEKYEPQKPTNLGMKMSHFFSNTHNQILQHKLERDSVKQIIREDSREELASPPVILENTSPTDSLDSGVGTPLSPKHPLSNCDVNFTFNGTTKLKNIRNIRNISRNSSPDLLGK